MSSLTFISQQIVIYVGFFQFVAGLIGGPLVLIVFLSLKTFRQSSCAFYLTIMSIVNIFHLFTGLLTFIMINGFGINWTDMSIFYCKFRLFYVWVNALTSFTCMCLATIDQFLATCSNPRWHRFNNVQFARYMVMGTVIVWLLQGIPFILYDDLTLSLKTNTSNCVITNAIFNNYFNIFLSFVLGNTLPIIFMFSFGILAYRNIQQIAHRTLPIVRRELDKQLTMMVLVQVFCDVLAVTPSIIHSVCSLIIGTPSDLVTLTQLSSFWKIGITLYYFHYVSSFYIYVCVSKRFRQQLIYVLFTVHRNRCRPRRMINKQVEPQT